MSRALGGERRTPRAADRSSPVETYAWGSDARGTVPQQDDPTVSSRTRRVAQWAHAGVGGCRAEASPLVQGRVGQCPTASKSRAASRLKRRLRQAMPRPGVPSRTRERHGFFAEKLAKQRGACAAREETRCVVNAANGADGAELPRIAWLRATLRASCARRSTVGPAASRSPSSM